jgi:hypothetical protein
LICEKQERWEQAVKALQRMAQLRPEAEDWKGIFLRVKQAVEAAGGTLNVQKAPPTEEEAQPPSTSDDAAEEGAPSPPATTVTPEPSGPAAETAPAPPEG